MLRSRRGDLVEVIWWDGRGACLFVKRLEKGRLLWPAAAEGKVALTPAQLAAFADDTPVSMLAPGTGRTQTAALDLWS